MATKTISNTNLTVYGTINTKYTELSSHNFWVGSTSDYREYDVKTINYGKSVYLFSYGGGSSSGIGDAKQGLHYWKDSSNNFTMSYVDCSGTHSYFPSTSDKRYKTKISDLSAEEANAVLSGVTPILFYYNWSNEEHIHMGLYAQDVRDALINNNIGYRNYLLIQYKLNLKDYTEDLFAEEETVNYGLDYSKLTPTLIKGWQNNQNEITQLEQENEELEKRIIELEKRYKEKWQQQ